MSDATVAEEALVAAARCSDNAVESAALAHAHALARAADVYHAALRAAPRYVYTAAVEVNNRAQGDLLDARDLLSAAWAADDRDAGVPSDGSGDTEGSVASED